MLLQESSIVLPVVQLPTTYTVIVGNIGKVFEGESFSEAQNTYNEYVSASMEFIGRAAGEDCRHDSSSVVGS